MNDLRRTIVQIVVTSYENYTPLLFEVSEDLSEEEIKKWIFEAFKEVYEKEKEAEKEVVDDESEAGACIDAEYIMMSDEFTDALKRRGIKPVEADVSFKFWGWNCPAMIWEDVSSELDRELWKFVMEADER